jgi:hypothetical protein
MPAPGRKAVAAALLFIRILCLLDIGNSLRTQPQAPKGPSVSSRSPAGAGLRRACQRELPQP